MKRTKRTLPLSDQRRRHAERPVEETDLHGNLTRMISTGSTLLDLAISGGRVRGGGIPSGIFVEIFGPESSGKTILLTEIAGAVQRQGGQVMFRDPEGRLNKQFAKVFGLEADKIDYDTPDTVTELFQAVRKWTPTPDDAVHGVFADSLAALSTDMEMGSDEGDKMGGRRAKEFSQELRRTCRELAKKNYLMVTSNQLRDKINVKFGPKSDSPGGRAIRFYASLRLKTNATQKITRDTTINGKDVKRVIGVQTKIQVVKSSVWEPDREATITALFKYGIDDIRENLQFIKDYTRATTYTIGGQKLGQGMNTAIRKVEQDKELITQLREEVIDLWEEIESKFKLDRKPKER